MKKVLLLVVTALIFISCSSDNDDESINTFLEEYGDTIWLEINENSSATVYRYFEKNLNSPSIKVVNLNLSDDCFYYGAPTLEYAEILENTESTFKIEYFYDAEEFVINTYTITNGNMTRSWYEYYNGNVTEAEFNLVEMSLTIDDINFCD